MYVPHGTLTERLTTVCLFDIFLNGRDAGELRRRTLGLLET